MPRCAAAVWMGSQAHHRRDASADKEIKSQCDCKHESCALNYELAQGSMPT
jgi:hypothetical protein